MLPHQIANSPPVRLIPGISPPLPRARGAMVGAPDEETELGARACARNGFEWHQNGLSIWVSDSRGAPTRVFFPLHRVDLTFQREAARVGCPLGPTVGDFSVGGFFKKIGRGIKRASRRVKSAKRRIDRAVRRAAGKTKFTRALWKAGDKLHRTAKKIGRVGKKIVRSKAFRAGLAGAAMAFPAIAPGVAALEAAQQIADRVEKAKRLAKTAARAINNPKRAGQIIAGRAAAEIAGRAFEAAERGDAQGMEMVGAFRALQRTAPKGKGALRAARGLGRSLRRSARRRVRRAASRAARSVPYVS